MTTNGPTERLAFPASDADTASAQAWNVAVDFVRSRAERVRDAFYEAVVACGRRPPFKPAISISAAPDAMRYDPAQRAVVVVPYAALPAPRRAAMERYAAIGTLGLNGHQQYVEIFNDLLVAHELGHWLQALAQRPLSRWQAEYQANQVMVAFWREHPAKAPAAATALRLANFVAHPQHLLDTLADAAAQSEPTCSDESVAAFERQPMAYAAMQKAMVRRAMAESPAPRLAQLLAALWPPPAA